MKRLIWLALNKASTVTGITIWRACCQKLDQSVIFSVVS